MLVFDVELIIEHYNDVIMGEIASQITNLTIVYSIVYSDSDQRKHQSSASLAFVRGIHRGPVNSPHKWPVTRKIFPFDDVIMSTSVHVRLGTEKAPNQSVIADLPTHICVTRLQLSNIIPIMCRLFIRRRPRIIMVSTVSWLAASQVLIRSINNSKLGIMSTFGFKYNDFLNCPIEFGWWPHLSNINVSQRIEQMYLAKLKLSLKEKPMNCNPRPYLFFMYVLVRSYPEGKDVTSVTIFMLLADTLFTWLR